jgi:hypothetical protein
LSSRSTLYDQNPSYQEELKNKMVETTTKKNTPEPKPKKTEPAKSKTGTSAAKKSKT